MHMSKQKQQKNTSLNITVKFKTDLMLQFMPYSNKTICHYQLGEAIIKKQVNSMFKTQNTASVSFGFMAS